MKRFKVDFTNEAWAKIEAPVRFIAGDRQAPINAARRVNRLLKTVDDLAWMPRLHPLDERQTSDLGETVYRMVFEQTYLIFYVVHDDDEEVWIIGFDHGSRQAT